MYNLIKEKEVEMILAIVVLLCVLAVIFGIKFMPPILTGILLFLTVICLTVGICVLQPSMHKPFSINVIEYLVKFNDDGSVTTTKQTTTTVLEDKVQK